MTEPTEAQIQEACDLLNEDREKADYWEPADYPKYAHIRTAAHRIAQRDTERAEHEAAMQRVSEIMKAALALGHKDDCTSPYGYPERCSCGFGALVKPFQEFILPDPTPTPEQVLVDALKALVADPNKLADKLEDALAKRGHHVAPIKDTRHD